MAGGGCATARTDGLVLVFLGAGYLGLPALKTLWNRYLHSEADWDSCWQSVLSVALFLVIALSPFVAWILYAHHYTGTFVQASAQMKQLWREKVVAGMNYFEISLFSTKIVLSWVIKSIIKVPMLKYVLPFMTAVIAGITFTAGKRACWLFHLLWLYPLLLGVAYGISFPKTWTWYFAPGLVTLTVMSACGIAVAFNKRRDGKLKYYIGRCLPVLMLLAAVESFGYLISKGIRGRNRNQTDMLQVARWIHHNISEDYRLAAWNSGIYGWYSGHVVINLDGLINNEIYTHVVNKKRIDDYIHQRNISFVVDAVDYPSKFGHGWDQNYYEIEYLYESKNMQPIAVWRVKSVR